MDSMDVAVNPSLLTDHLKRCPGCKDFFTYHRYDTSDCNFPLLLECGHSMCFVCVFDGLQNLAERTAEDVEEQLCGDFFQCATCGKPHTDIPVRHTPMTGLSFDDVMGCFPLDLYTVGWLAAQDNLPRDMLPILDELKPIGCAFQSCLTRTIPGGVQFRCDKCAGLYRQAFCSICTSYLCLTCINSHVEECSNPSMEYLDHNGHRFEAEEAGQHCPQHNLALQFIEKESGEPGCYDCVTQNSDKKYVRIQSRNATLIGEKTAVTTRLGDEIVEQTEESIRLIGKSLLVLPEKCSSDCMDFMRFLNQLVSSLAKKQEDCLKTAAESDGQRLSILQETKKALEVQRERLENIQAKLAFFIREGENLATDLEQEITAIVDEMKDFGMFDRAWIEAGRIDWKELENVELDEHMTGNLRQYVEDIEEKLTFGPDAKSVLDVESFGTYTDVVEGEDGCKVYRLSCGPAKDPME